MGQEAWINGSTTLFEVVGFWLLIILLIYFLLRGILKGNAQKWNDKIIELEKRIELLEKQIEKE